MFYIIILITIYPFVEGQFLPKYTDDCGNKQSRLREDVGEPLYLTPYVKYGRIEEGRKLAKVPFTEKQLGIISYAGFFNVNETYNSQQFFWYFPPIEQIKNAPVIVWLQGGPGASSLFGLFNLNGPIVIKKNILQIRDINWALNHHMIYIDNPVGAGYSFTEDLNGYCTDEVQVGDQLHKTVTQFFQLFPELQSHDFFVAGESYAGKYVPALAYAIHKNNPSADVKINLKGIAIGNGLIDPINQLIYSDYLYQNGLIDFNAVEIFKTYESLAIDFIYQHRWRDAYEQFNDLIMSDTCLFFNMTGFHFQYNYLHTENYLTDENYDCFLNKTDVRKSIHVGNLPFQNGKLAKEYLLEDIMQSVAPWLSELLDHYKVLLYSGQLDIIIPYTSTVNFLKKLKFEGYEDYYEAERKIWRVDGEIAGYVKKCGRLVEVLVRNAGHMVPRDQPIWALDLITKFTNDLL